MTADRAMDAPCLTSHANQMDQPSSRLASSSLSRRLTFCRPQFRQLCPRPSAKPRGSVHHFLSIAARIRLFANSRWHTLAAQG